MSEKKTASVTIDGKTYTEDQLNDQQKVMVNHVADLGPENCFGTL
jgi:hypothetical protein